MTPKKQKYLHIPDSQNGDCWRTCVASILNCDVEVFPYHNGDITWPEEWKEMLSILKGMGYYYDSIPVSSVAIGLLNCFDTDGYCIAIGPSNRGVTHAVVWKNGIAHDPHPDNTGIMQIERFEILTKISAVNEPENIPDIDDYPVTDSRTYKNLDGTVNWKKYAMALRSYILDEPEKPTDERKKLCKHFRYCSTRTSTMATCQDDSRHECYER